jgi:mRNA-degrading endonuclease toxin of MazEF toxin-antitoxin module
LTRPDVIDVRQLVTVAEIATSVCGIAVEVTVDHEVVGLEKTSAINCDGHQAIRQPSLTRRIGTVSDTTMGEVCRAIGYALGCQWRRSLTLT